LTTAIILAAGEGSRLRPHTLRRPKCQVKVQGKEMIEYQLDILSKQCTDIIIVGGYLSESLRKYKLPLIVNNEYKRTNMVYSLYCAGEAVLDKNDDLIITYGDIIYSPEHIEKLIAFSDGDFVTINNVGWESYWSQRQVDILSDAETFQIDESDRLIELGKPLKSVNSANGQFTGLIKCTKYGTKILFNEIDRLMNDNSIDKNMYMTDLLMHLISKGLAIDTLPVDGNWLEIDTDQDLNFCNDVAKVTLPYV
jgi:L-glutamine-phosphate cytidylyltransferase